MVTEAIIKRQTVKTELLDVQELYVAPPPAKPHPMIVNSSENINSPMRRSADLSKAGYAPGWPITRVAMKPQVAIQQMTQPATRTPGKSKPAVPLYAGRRSNVY